MSKTDDTFLHIPIVQCPQRTLLGSARGLAKSPAWNGTRAGKRQPRCTQKHRQAGSYALAAGCAEAGSWVGGRNPNTGDDKDMPRPSCAPLTARVWRREHVSQAHEALRSLFN